MSARETKAEAREVLVDLSKHSRGGDGGAPQVRLGMGLVGGVDDARKTEQQVQELPCGVFVSRVDKGCIVPGIQVGDQLLGISTEEWHLDTAALPLQVHPAVPFFFFFFFFSS